MAITTHRPLPAELKAIQDEMEAIAAGYGLDFFETIFEVLDYEELSMFAAYGGFPVRYPHWRFGAEYDELMKSYSYGLSKIYEMVINTDPCYAYLLSANAITDQKLVIAHVYGHCDFFKCNAWFSKTNRRMLDQMANHAARINRYIDRFGYDAVEQFIDACLSIDDLIDPHAPHIRRTRDPKKVEEEAARRKHEEERKAKGLPEARGRFQAKDYMDAFVNPPDVLQAEEAARKKRDDAREASRSFPEEPQRDVLQFLLKHAPLKEWQHDILAIIRDEAYYFAPQGQTKIMNEGWACVAAGTLVYTDRGLIPMAEVVEGGPAEVCDGTRRQTVYDSHVIRDQPTVTVETRRGIKLTGSANHRLLLADGRTWRRMDELAVGERLTVAGGVDLWPVEEVALEWQPARRVGLQDVADQAGVSVWTVLRHRNGRRTRTEGANATALAEYDSAENQSRSMTQANRREISIPERLDAALGAFVGYLIGDGHISRMKRNLGLTTGDAQSANTFAALAHELFDLDVSCKRDGGRLRVLLHSEMLADFLTAGLGLTSGPSAAEKSVPDAVLRSPERVVSAFLRAYFDCDAYAGPQGIILSSKSDTLSSQVQLLLLNYGILSRRRPQTDGCWHVHVTGASAQKFAERIGFGLARKQAALSAYLDGHRWLKAERWEDEVVAIEHGRADVYDISVTETHRYAAAGLVNHNSYWHSKIMTRHGLTDAEVIDYADHHSGTMAMSPQRINPYKVGIELFKDIEERWDKGRFGVEWEECDNIDARKHWDRELGLGRDKIFEVRRVHNDVTFIDTFLTEDFCRKHKMFTFAYNEHTGDYEIASREFKAIKQQLLTSLTNHGRPFIFVKDGNYKNRGELYLRHDYQGIELKQDYARDTLVNLQKLWGRPVHIETVVDDEPTVISYDGTTHEVRSA